MSTAPDSISIHDGTVDPASLTCRPPGDVFVDLLHTLRLLGVTVHCDESFRLVCIRRESRTFQIRSPSLPSLIFSVNADPSMDPVYGDPSFDHGEEVRFMMEICRFRHLADLYLVDSRLMRGPDPVYQFLRTKILGLLRLSKA
ncbi:uncharacterized protein BYT42DRAFT_626731 [Radiomyces spectabilis]|uniref:uncharacterized protein n=1 Tax=Radiomyces spectabilis TaxID=64574 RepID=UPI0022203F46|nr:uncharacterized protein BYT42DRAFT_626731 [Radiomyces spectabilis]KAI8366002.1 hypothetical protein BYT42DRAFT_626731 [Radiomyces spectabilis]